MIELNTWKELIELIKQFLKFMKFDILYNLILEKAKRAPRNVCWKGYKMVGMKKKNGKEVPNCVPSK